MAVCCMRLASSEVVANRRALNLHAIRVAVIVLCSRLVVVENVLSHCNPKLVQIDLR